jgi:hypothetical protein
VTRRRTILAGAATVVAVGAVAAVIVANVGGAEHPSPAEYLAAVEVICAEYGAKLDEIPPPGDLSSPGSVVESLQQALPVLVEQEEKVRSLEAPASLRPRLERFFDLTDGSIAELRKALAAALERALYPMAVALTEFGEVRDRAKRVAGDIGFQC